jgi:uridine phosphorylase
MAIMKAARELGVKVTSGICRTHDGLFLESPFAHDGVEERIKPWREVGVSAIDNEVAALYAIASILQLQAGAVYVVTDNLTTNESMDFINDYDDRMLEAIKIAQLALAKIIKGE